MNKQEIIDRLNFLRAQELFAIQQYMHHYYMVEGIDFQDVKEIERSTAISEMKHAEALAEKINMLGGTPITHPGKLEQFRSDKGDIDVAPATSTEEMLRADLSLERNAIKDYTAAINDIGNTDPGTRKMLEDILVEEEEHADNFATWLAEDQAYDIRDLKEAG